MTYIEDLGRQAKAAARVVRLLSAQAKNDALEAIAVALLEQQTEILAANERDLENGRQNGLTTALLERLTLTEARIQGMVDGLRQIAALPDPILKTDSQWVNKDGLRISRRRVPLGVVGIIYESRPNVTVDASALCLKAGNAVILRGGKEALESNQAIVAAVQAGLAKSKVPSTAVQLITDPSRELATEFMQLNQYVDCLVPRGGAGLIQAVLRQATVPVIETGVGNCHLYVHTEADFEQAYNILLNGKLQRPSVCNALENLLVDAEFAEKFLPEATAALIDAGVEILGDEKVVELVPQATLATDEDYATEFLDYRIAVKIVDNYEEAVAHIERFSTGHSDAIVTKDYSTAQHFLNDIDSACVYVNASTRFSDGEVFGFGGELGISTQKLHARGPMGLEALTSYKYVIEGDGQVRA
ncbi:glutamate-5-semialdehyde dehydrogenase [Aerococcaceae bacterium WS4759]|uniref:Gamma-glutamyl phosphate reductase n=1 Tax=Fundicoccus ignavus TaxID=2664442 RepID=A0A6I2H0T1_9LACT|nr:glutamate-5-semialdehyde dehydrogenase [Fundicoccus ignavus]MRI86233.1 glutamate-5-semialdehyde dehydrogenase [Fundicoccus ignavus]